jgi:prepilin signal peptidase PulO-like enzyme (type II secretory pathway)
MIRKRVSEPFFVKAIRIITGVVFIFSAVVKGVDPLGTDYRVIDYLEAYGWYFFMDYSMAISVLLISAEFLIGIALLFKLRARLAALGVLLLMIYFTVVTYIDARYELVPDCGCFGDAIKLTNWETFYKNIVLLIFAIIIFMYQRKMVLRMRVWLQFVVLFSILGSFIFFMDYNYSHLPAMDFRDWKIGNDMKSTGQETVVSYLAYKNKNTGEIKEYISPDYPWNDSVWMSEWEFLSQRIDDSKLVLKHGLIIEDENGNNFTTEIIENPDYQFVLSVYDIQTADIDGMKNAGTLFNSLIDSDVGFAMLSSSGSDEIDNYKVDYGINYDVYLADDIELKAMIRANPGLVLLKNGVVIEKWHHNDFPDISEVSELITE